MFLLIKSTIFIGITKILELINYYIFKLNYVSK